MTGLRIDTRPLDDLEDKLLVSPRGPIRATNGEQFRDHVDGLIKDPATTCLIIDFTRVESIDSSTAGYLLNVHDRLSTKGGRLALASLTTGVRVVIDSIGLTTFFTVCETVEDALIACSQ